MENKGYESGHRAGYRKELEHKRLHFEASFLINFEDKYIDSTVERDLREQLILFHCHICRNNKEIYQLSGIG